MSDQSDTPHHHYVAFIDEAGDSGIDRVRPLDNPGASEWLVIGAVLIEATDELRPVEWRNVILREARVRAPTLHYQTLLEWQKPLVCHQLSTFPIKAFAMLSNKKNMRGYVNPRAAARGNPLTSKQVFYNFCLRLILERVTDFVLRHSIKKYGSPRYVKIVFSKRGGHSHSHTFAYNEILKAQNRSGTTLLKRREIKWQVIDRRLQEAHHTEEIAGLQLADIVASSFFQAVDILPPTKWNPTNAKLLRDVMAQEAGYFHDYGVTFQPSPAMTEAMLVPKQKEIFESYGFDSRDFDIPWFLEARSKGRRRAPASMSVVSR